MIVYDAGTLTNKTKVVLESDHTKEIEVAYSKGFAEGESKQAILELRGRDKFLEGVREKHTKEIEKWRVAEREISDAYLRIRQLVGAWDTQEGGSDRFEVTELAIKKLVAFWEWSRLADKMTFESYEWKK